jgi:hypothetical protein
MIVPTFPDLMMGLDRCEHGRHIADSCFNCPGGRSGGNPHLRMGQLIGYTVHGAEVRIPHWENKNNPDAWVVPIDMPRIEWFDKQKLVYRP